MTEPLFSSLDHAMMAQALSMAEGGRCISTPNPAVGCVLVRDGRVIGRGHTQQAGGPHAEVMALRDAAVNGENTLGATAYVSLEPCAHHGRTPPCARALVDAKLARVVVAIADPNPLVAGQGLAILRAAGIEVASGLLQTEARESLKGFLSRIERARPWLQLKLAASLDGKVALANGQSQWISCEPARQDVKRLRRQVCAIMTGSGTVLADDPRLTIRQADGRPDAGRQPLRVVLDSQARMSATARMLSEPGSTLHISARASVAALQGLREAGAQCITLTDGQGRVDLPASLAQLAKRGINTAMVEAGGCLSGALLNAGLVDELVLYQAPVLLGGAARDMAMFTLENLADKLQPKVWDVRQIGADMRYTLRFTSA